MEKPALLRSIAVAGTFIVAGIVTKFSTVNWKSFVLVCGGVLVSLNVSFTLLTELAGKKLEGVSEMVVILPFLVTVGLATTPFKVSDMDFGSGIAVLPSSTSAMMGALGA